MSNCGNSRGRPTQVGPISVRCSLCHDPIIYTVCDHCNGLSFGNCPKPEQQVILPKINNEDDQRGAVGSSESSFRHILREGSRMLERVSKNVASATDHLFGVEEEDIDRVVEEFKKTQLEGKGKK